MKRKDATLYHSWRSKKSESKTCAKHIKKNKLFFLSPCQSQILWFSYSGNANTNIREKKSTLWHSPAERGSSPQASPHMQQQISINTFRKFYSFPRSLPCEMSWWGVDKSIDFPTHRLGPWLERTKQITRFGWFPFMFSVHTHTHSRRTGTNGPLRRCRRRQSVWSLINGVRNSDWQRTAEWNTNNRGLKLIHLLYDTGYT